MLPKLRAIGLELLHVSLLDHAGPHFKNRSYSHNRRLGVLGAQVDIELEFLFSHSTDTVKSETLSSGSCRFSFSTRQRCQFLYSPRLCWPPLVLPYLLIC